jgi:hypothetical protein
VEKSLEASTLGKPFIQSNIISGLLLVSIINPVTRDDRQMGVV